MKATITYPSPDVVFEDCNGKIVTGSALNLSNKSLGVVLGVTAVMAQACEQAVDKRIIPVVDWYDVLRSVLIMINDF